jgi:hypothetical protein
MSTNHGGILEAVLLELKHLNQEIQALRADLAQLKVHAPPPDMTTTGGNGGGTHDPQAAEAREEEEVDNDTTFLTLTDWLASRDITVKNHRREQATDEIFDRLATFLGERFDSIQTLHDQIRRNLSNGGNFTLNLSSSSQEEIANTTQLCTWLHEYAFLSSYNYNNTSKTLYAAPQRVGRVINFFNGGWFERFVTLKVSAMLAERGLDASHLANPQIVLPNGDNFELDLIFLVENEPLWLECKTGNYQAYVTKYADVRPILGIPEARAILVILGISDDLASRLTDLYGITVANETTLLSRVAQALLPLKRSAGAAETPPTPSPIRPVSSLLNKAGLRPVPEVRTQAILELLDWVRTMEAPQTMAEIKPHLADRLALSRSKTQDLLNAVVRGGCLIDEAGNRVPNLTTPFTGLDPSDPEAIERRCMESYTRAILQTAPSYFDAASNVRAFEEATGGSLPDEETLTRLRAQGRCELQA